MVKQELTVSPKVAKVFIIFVGFISLGLCLGKGHGLGGLVGDTNVVKVDGMVELIFFGDNNDGVSRDNLIHGNVDAEKKKDHKKADDDDGYNLPFFSHL
jgi:hypothetical protein